MKPFAFCCFLCLLFACALDENPKMLGDADATIHLLINEPELQNLKKKRAEALRLGKLLEGKDDWQPALIRHAGNSNRAKVRLKGDLSDHWNHEKEWSFKVKLEGSGGVYGMNRFALQRPATRGFLNEWYLHKFLSFTGLIALKYNFVQVAINGNSLPIYAIEENFHSNLVKRNDRPEGLLFKFNGDFYWHHKPGLVSKFYGTRVTAFQSKMVRGNEMLSAQLKVVRGMMDKFRAKQLSTHEIFDCKQMAKLFVAIDLMGHHHATALDNIRFFYNAKTRLVEPIGYDNQLISDLKTQGLLGADKTINGHYIIDEWNFTNGYWYQYLFADTIFMKEYIDQLVLMGKPAYLDKFFDQTNLEFTQILHLIQTSYPDYNFSGKDIIYENQKYLRNELDRINGYYDSINDNISEVYQLLHHNDGDTLSTIKTSENDRKIMIKELNLVSNNDGSLYYKNLALLDIVGCSSIKDAAKWINDEDDGLDIVEYKYKAISKYLFGLSKDFITGHVSENNHIKRLVSTLQNLCETSDFKGSINEISWFNNVYARLDSNGKQLIQINRKFILDYLSPQKAIFAEFKGIAEVDKSIELEVQNIHMLPILIDDININGQQIPLIREEVVEGAVHGNPLPKKKFQVKIGSSQFFQIKRILADRNFEMDQFEVNYRVLGSGFQVSEKILYN